MIVLDIVNPQDRIANLREVDIPADVGTNDFARIEQLVEQLGVHDLDLRQNGDGLSPGVEHRWMCYDGCIHYEASFPHDLESRDGLAVYSAVVLATHGQLEGSMVLQLRLAVYELCLNVLEHGRPKHSGATLRLGFRFEPEKVCGWVEDECEPFNPLGRMEDNVVNRVALRARRGYGIMIVRKLMDELTHQFNGHGNRTEFAKKVTI